MKKYICDVCGYEYDPEVGDPENGIEPGTAFEDLPEDWVCPLCGVGKDIGFAHFAVLVRTSSPLHSSAQRTRRRQRTQSALLVSTT